MVDSLSKPSLDTLQCSFSMLVFSATRCPSETHGYGDGNLGIAEVVGRKTVSKSGRRPLARLMSAAAEAPPLGGREGDIKQFS